MASRVEALQAALFWSHDRPHEFAKRHGMGIVTFVNWAVDVGRSESPTDLLRLLRWLKTYSPWEGRSGVTRWSHRRFLFAIMSRIWQRARDSIEWSVPTHEDVGHSWYFHAPLIVDGTHLPIRKFGGDYANRRYHSHKMRNTLCVTYQFVFDPWRQRIVHVWGPVPASVPDITIWHRSGVSLLMPDNRFVIGDPGYQGGHMIVTTLKPNAHPDLEYVASNNRRVRAIRWQVEAVFSRLKNFQVFATPWRHDRKCHVQAVMIVASVLNADLQERPLDRGEVIDAGEEEAGDRGI